MRCARLALSALALALVTVAATASAGTYQDLRSRPSVRRAIDSMPSGINGSMNRVSNALDDMTALDVTPSTERRIIVALEALETDLRSGLPSLELVDRLMIAQVVERIAFRLVPDIFPDGAPPPCDDGFGQWYDGCHADATIVADRIAEMLEGSIRAGVDQYRLENPSLIVQPVPMPPDPGISAENFDRWLLPTLLSAIGYLPDLETIDVE